MTYQGPRKLYIDSRYRSSGSHSDSTFQLAQSVEMPPGYVAIIDNVQIPNAFQTVESGRDKLYVQLFYSNENSQERVISLTHGQYNAITLAQELEAQLNAWAQEPSALSTVRPLGGSPLAWRTPVSASSASGIVCRRGRMTRWRSSDWTPMDSRYSTILPRSSRTIARSRARGFST